MLPKEDRKAMLLRLYNDDSPLMDHSKGRSKAQANSIEDGDTSFMKDEEEDDIEPNDNGLIVDAEADVNGVDVEEQAAKELDVILGVKDQEDVDKEMG